MTTRGSRGITPAAAATMILDAVRPLEAEDVVLRSARDRVLATDIRSPLNVPPWDNSAMDGYAVSSSDLAAAAEHSTPVVLEIVEEIAAGQRPTRALSPGQCTRLFTGAPVPEGADTVVRQEDTAEVSAGSVRVENFRDMRRNIRRRGEDIAVGATVLHSGTVLAAAQLGVLASIARSPVPVTRQPRVALLATGDEIVDLDQVDAILSGERIPSSNSYTLRAGVEDAGGVPIDLGIARDDPVDIAQRLQGARQADLLVTTAGMSVGTHDHLRALLESEGTETKFWRLRARPGAPVGFGILDGVPWIGLPGNPVSTLVTFELFVRPAVRRLGGHEAWFRSPTRVRAADVMPTPGALQYFLRVTLERTDDLPLARLTGPQGSGVLTSMARADALLIVPEHVEQVEMDSVVSAIPLRGGEYGTEVPY